MTAGVTVAGGVEGAGLAVAARTTGVGVGVAGSGDGVSEAGGAGDVVEAAGMRVGTCAGVCVASGTARPGYRPAPRSGEAPGPVASEAATSPAAKAQTSMTLNVASNVLAFGRLVLTIPQQLEQWALRRHISASCMAT